MKISRIEKETIILFNEQEVTASVYTYNGSLKQKLSKLALDFPKQISVGRKDSTGAIEYLIPKNLISIRKPVSETVKQLRREQALKHKLGSK